MDKGDFHEDSQIICAAKLFVKTKKTMRDNEYLTLHLLMHFCTITYRKITLGWEVESTSLLAETSRESPYEAIISPCYYAWLKPTLSVTRFQHLTHLFMLRANCPVFRPGSVPLVIFFQLQWYICLASKHCQSYSCSREYLEWGVRELFSKAANKSKSFLKEKLQSINLLPLITYVIKMVHYSFF